MTAREPLIPLAILGDPVARCALLLNSFGWGPIVALNIFLPMYLQTVIGLSPTTAGLSLIVLMVSVNTSAGIFGPVFGRLTPYKIMPIGRLLVAIAAGPA